MLGLGEIPFVGIYRILAFGFQPERKIIDPVGHILPERGIRIFLHERIETGDALAGDGIGVILPLHRDTFVQNRFRIGVCRILGQNLPGKIRGAGHIAAVVAGLRLTYGGTNVLDQNDSRTGNAGMAWNRTTYGRHTKYKAENYISHQNLGSKSLAALLYFIELYLDRKAALEYDFFSKYSFPFRTFW